jgi:hypothetical protein
MAYSLRRGLTFAALVGLFTTGAGCIIVPAAPPRQPLRPVQSYPQSPDPAWSASGDTPAGLGAISGPRGDTPAAAWGGPAGDTPAVAWAADVMDSWRFTRELEWALAGNTPAALWSPDNLSLVVASDIPQRSRDDRGTKVFDLVDIRAMTQKTFYTGKAYYPIWIDNASLGYVCFFSRCGVGRNGAYALSLRGKSRRVFPGSIESLGYRTDGQILIMEVSDQTGNLEWTLWDPKTGARGPAPLDQNGSPPPSEYRDPCPTVVGGFLLEVSPTGIIMKNAATGQERVIADARAWPMYPEYYAGPPYNQACFSPDGRRIVYYSYDARRGAGVATLLRIDK